jgi:hypothetical protein
MHVTFEVPASASPGLSAQLGSLAEVQDGVARRAQLDRCGLTRSALDNMLNSGRWKARGQVVIVMHNGILTRQQMLWAAVLNAGDLVELAARTAATAFGLSGWDADCVEILVVKGTCVPPGLGLDVKVHESRRFSSADLHPGRAIPTVRCERALIDAAVWSFSRRTACGVLAAGVQQRLTTAQRLIAELSLAGAVRHRRVLMAALVDIDGGAQSMSEIDFLRFCRRHGIPRPEMQRVRRDSAGRRRYLDATFTRRDGKKVRVEIDGALHLVVATYWSDMSRGNDLVIGNETVLRFPSFVIHANDVRAVAQLRAALGLSGSQRAIAS